MNSNRRSVWVGNVRCRPVPTIRSMLFPTAGRPTVRRRPATVGDRATFQDPQQYAVGMVNVFVNGQQVVANGRHTGAKPGRVVHGPGYATRAD